MCVHECTRTHRRERALERFGDGALDSRDALAHKSKLGTLLRKAVNDATVTVTPESDVISDDTNNAAQTKVALHIDMHIVHLPTFVCTLLFVYTPCTAVWRTHVHTPFGRLFVYMFVHTDACLFCDVHDVMFVCG